MPIRGTPSGTGSSACVSSSSWCGTSLITATICGNRSARCRRACGRHGSSWSELGKPWFKGRIDRGGADPGYLLPVYGPQNRSERKESAATARLPLTASPSAFLPESTPSATNAVARAPSHNTGPEMKQWRRPQRTALRTHPVPIHAKATAHVTAVHESGRCRKFVDTPRASGNTHQKRTPTGWRSQSVEGAEDMGEPLRCSIVISGSPTTSRITCGPCQLNGRARHRAVGAEHAAIARLGSEQVAARETFEEVDAGAGRHRLPVERRAEWAGELRFRHCDAGGGMCRHRGAAGRPSPSTIVCTLAAKV